MIGKKAYKNSVAFHPGSYVRDVIEDLNISQEEFASRLGAPTKSISRLISGEERLSEELAMKLSKFTGVSSETWLNLQNSYDIKTLNK